MASDSITVLCSPDERIGAKTFRKDTGGRVSVIPYSAGYLFLSFTQPVGSLEDLSDVLDELEKEPWTFVIRGEHVVPHVPGITLLRKTGAGEGSDFTGNFITPSVGRSWVLVDIDKLILPAGLTLLPRNLAKVVRWVAGLLPAELQDVSFHWQLSSSAGVFSREQVSIHLWFWLTSPVPNSDLKAWANAVNTRSNPLQIDTALFQHVQAHYTARPSFEGLSDPFPKRSGLLRLARDAATIPPQNGSKSLPIQASSIAHSSVVSSPVGFDAILTSIGDHDGGAGFRHPLLRAAASFVRSHGTEGTDPEALFELLRGVVLAADASKHTPDDIEERASRETIMPMIRSAMAKFGHIKSIGTPNLIRGISPLKGCDTPVLSQQSLASEIDSLFDF